MSLNLSTKRLSFQINDNQEIVIENIQTNQAIKYKMAVCVGGGSVVLEYSKEANNQNDDEKEQSENMVKQVTQV